MKTVTKIAFLMLTMAMAMGFGALAQPCVPTTSFPGNQGILPFSLPDGVKGTPYSVVIQYKAPVDTDVVYNGQTVKFTVDSMRPLAVYGMPDGIGYECFNTTCLVNGGQVGCILLSGAPTVSGLYPLIVPVKTSGKVSFIVPIPVSRVDSQNRYSINVTLGTGLHLIDETNLLNVYPNPSNDKVTIRTNAYEHGKLAIYDLSGKLMTIQQVKAEEAENTLDVSTFEKGLYFVEYTTDHFLSRTKLLVN